MPIFISYSHENKDFVDKLAIQLVQNNVNVWMDRWELSIGDSLIDKVQEAADGASALLVIMSKASIASEWCKKELSAGFLRELEEKRVVVMPILLEDCEIPLFARGKLYADFRANFDDGLRTVVEGIAKVTNPFLSRSNAPQYHTDWSLEWRLINGNFVIILNFVEQAKNQPFTCLTNMEVHASSSATYKYHQNCTKHNEEYAVSYIVGILNEHFAKDEDYRLRLVSEREHIEHIIIQGNSPQEMYRVRVGSRRLGEDTGRDILVNVTRLISQAYKHITEVLHFDVTKA